MRVLDARAATAAVLLFLYAALWLFVLSLAGWIGVARWVFVVLTATQAAWVIGGALLAGWGWGRPAALIYALFGLALGAWSAWTGITTTYSTADWIFTAIAGVAPILVGGLLLKPIAR